MCETKPQTHMCFKHVRHNFVLKIFFGTLPSHGHHVAGSHWTEEVWVFCSVLSPDSQRERDGKYGQQNVRLLFVSRSVHVRFFMCAVSGVFIVSALDKSVRVKHKSLWSVRLCVFFF